MNAASTNPASSLLRFVLGTLIALAMPVSLASAAPPIADWVPTWGVAPELLNTPFNDQTIRMIVRTTLGGKQVRIRLSNLFGTATLQVGGAHIALPQQGSTIRPGTDRRLTFGGQPTVEIPPGAYAFSDPAALDVPQLSDLAVTLYMPGVPTTTTLHRTGLRTTYISPTGDFTGATEFPEGKTTLSYYWLTDVYVQPDRHPDVIAAIGDSITDGTQSTPNSNGSWPSVLGKLLQAKAVSHPTAVIDEGVSGNRLLHDYNGTNALARFDRDVLDIPGLTTVILLEGINDIGSPVNPRSKYHDQIVTADEIIQGMQQLIERCHLHHVKIAGGTLLPYAGAGNYYTPEGDLIRETVNRWIRTVAKFDAVIDFAKAVDDPANPGHLQPAFDSGDHLHPRNAGYEAMASAAYDVVRTLDK